MHTLVAGKALDRASTVLINVGASKSRRYEGELPMSAFRLLKATSVGLLILAVLAFAPLQASAANQWWQQALLLVHIPLGGGQVFTPTYTYSPNEGAASINSKCFTDAFQRIGPAAGVNIALSATGQVAQHTPISLGVTTDPLFASGIGWCWAASVTS